MVVRKENKFKYFAIMLVLAIVGCSSKTVQKIEDDSPEDLLAKADFSIEINQPKLAWDNFILPLLEYCSSEVDSKGNNVLSARSDKEKKYYQETLSTQNKKIQVVDSVCSNTYFLAGYVQFELKNIQESEQFLQTGLNISPVNSKLLSELANVYQSKKQWHKALSTYEKAEINAQLYAPENKAKSEYARALRGSGYVLIEMGELDKASKKYQKALEIDSLDKIALGELKYIKNLREK